MKDSWGRQRHRLEGPHVIEHGDIEAVVARLKHDATDVNGFARVGNPGAHGECDIL